MPTRTSAERVHLVCPFCRARTARRHPRFPRCRACGQLLIRCRFCAHFDFRIMDCAHPFLADQIHISDPDQFTECQYHSFARPKSAALPARPRVRRLGATGAVLIAAAVLLAIFYRAGLGPAHRLFVLVTIPEQMSVGSAGQLRVLLLNRTTAQVRQTMVALDRPFLQKFETHFRELTPPPTAMRLSTGMLYLYFGGLPPDGQINVVLPIVAKRPGTHWLRYQIFSEEGMHQRGNLMVTVLP